MPGFGTLGSGTMFCDGLGLAQIFKRLLLLFSFLVRLHLPLHELILTSYGLTSGYALGSNLFLSPALIQRLGPLPILVLRI